MDQEKRLHRRIECSGHASVQINPSEPLGGARILDLSEGGCLVEFLRPPKLELDAKVEIFFCVNNLPFRVLGLVRSIHSATKLGFQFFQLRERKRLQIMDLIEELKEDLAKRVSGATRRRRMRLHRNGLDSDAEFRE